MVPATKVHKAMPPRSANVDVRITDLIGFPKG
jgi:hypothetical protein